MVVNQKATRHELKFEVKSRIRFRKTVLERPKERETALMRL